MSAASKHLGIRERIKALLGGGRELRPHSPKAYYDPDADSLRVELRDASYTEEKLNDFITLLVDNNPQHGRNAVAGIVIERAVSMLTRMGYRAQESSRINLPRFLNKLSKQFPELREQKIFRTLCEIDMTVDLAEIEPWKWAQESSQALMDDALGAMG